MEGPKQNKTIPTETTQKKEVSQPLRKHIKQTSKYILLNRLQGYFQLQMQKKLNSSSYNVFSIIDELDEDRVKYTGILKEVLSSQDGIDPSRLQLNSKLNRGIACLLGLAICDALGASTQFIPFVKNRRDLIAHDFNDVKNQIKNRVLDTRSGRIGIWTDDNSMALCMADSLLLNNYQFKAKHIRYMFHMWLEHGLNNGGRKYSIGLGGNISISMKEFCKNQEQYTEQGERFNNGNGSLMRLAPVPLCFVDNQKQAMEFSGKSSKTTHNGLQSEQCSKLLALILARLINRGQQPNWKSIINQACDDFVNKFKTCKTVQCLALSKSQPLQLYEEQLEQLKGKFKKFNKSVQDRNWNWKDPNFTYSPCRTQDQPGYIGSYCMDALSMALHTVWFTDSFKEVALMNANMGGDCDTVGAIAGQIAGAIYGIDEYMLHLYSQMEDATSGRFEVFLKAYKLMTHRPIV